MSRLPITNSIGRPRQEVSVAPSSAGIAQQLLGAVTQQYEGMPVINPEVMKGAPPWVAYLMNMVQNGLTQIEAIKLTLLRRGLVTEAEYTEALMTINRAVEEQFMATAKEIDRRVNQAPTDPRRSPT